MSIVKTVDLHGHTTESARRLLTQTLKTLPKGTKELVVIHGYHGSDALLKLARGFKNKKIERRILGLNKGQTIYIIKERD